MKERVILKYIIITILCVFINSCSEKTKSNSENQKQSALTKKSELDIISQKHPFLKNYVNTIKKDTLVYTKCDECNLPGLDKNNIIGYTDRVRPTGNYYRKDLEIGNFEFNSFLVYEKRIYESNDEHKRIYKRIYFCHFDENQKNMFNEFLHYYDNMIGHGKQMLDVTFIENTAVINIQYAGY